MELYIQATATLPRQEIFPKHVSSTPIHTSRAFPPPFTPLLLAEKNEAVASRHTLRPLCSSSETVRLVEKAKFSKTMDDTDFESAVDSETSSTNESSTLSSISLDGHSTEKPEASTTSKHKTGYVAVLGHPNVGKSTLSNQMVGQKLSIVTEKPQTTRHRILGICSGPHYQIILYDTPGIIKKKMHKLDSMMMTSVRGAASNANCAMVVVDASKVPQEIDHVLEGAGDTKLPTLVVLNKKDLVKPRDIASQLKWYEQFTDVVDEVIPISAKYADGVEDVVDWILSKLPYGPALYPKDIASQHPERFFIAEIIREKIFMVYRNEIPYSCQVNIVDYKSRPKAKDFIKAEIVVEKKSQCAILIGSGGKALKQVASAARTDIEKFLDKEVYLEVSVGVEKKWRQNEGYLKSYGYAWHMPPH